MNTRTDYYKPVEVLCEDNGRIVEGDVVNYVKGEYMTVALNGMSLSMQYNTKRNAYRASMSGLDFEAKDPESFYGHSER